MSAVRLRRAGYGRYEIASGPAAGTLIERSGARALPCRRWRAVSGPGAFCAINDGWTMRGLAAAVDATLRASEEVAS